MYRWPRAQGADSPCSGPGLMHGFTLSQRWVILHRRQNKPPRTPLLHLWRSPILFLPSCALHWLKQLSTHSAHRHKTPSFELWPRHPFWWNPLDSDPILWPFIWLCVSAANCISLLSVSSSKFSWLMMWPRVELIVRAPWHKPWGPPRLFQWLGSG